MHLEEGVYSGRLWHANDGAEDKVRAEPLLGSTSSIVTLGRRRSGQ
jgi:hypothetical protein